MGLWPNVKPKVGLDSSLRSDVADVFDESEVVGAPNAKSKIAFDGILKPSEAGDGTLCDNEGLDIPVDDDIWLSPWEVT